MFRHATLFNNRGISITRFSDGYAIGTVFNKNDYDDCFQMIPDMILIDTGADVWTPLDRVDIVLSNRIETHTPPRHGLTIPLQLWFNKNPVLAAPM